MTDHDPLERVAVALDTAEWERFEAWCRLFGPRVGFLKVGLEAFVRWGPRAVDLALEEAKGVFLDLKLHDIPNTVSGAVRAAREAGSPGILAVTLLTHLDSASLEELDMGGGSLPRVRSWTALAREAGCDGVVCSPLELSALRAAHPSPFRLVTPGIRPAPSGDDQRRVATPREAMAQGADILVIGRPLTGASDPEKALRALGESMAADLPPSRPRK